MNPIVVSFFAAFLATALLIPRTSSIGVSAILL
jgi:hypothetical protein